MRHLNGRLDRRLYANLVGEKVVVMPRTERGDGEMASVEVVPLVALDTCPIRLRKIFLEIIQGQLPAKAMERLAREEKNRPALRPNGNGREPKRRALFHRPRPRVVSPTVRRSGLSRGLR